MKDRQPAFPTYETEPHEPGAQLRDLFAMASLLTLRHHRVGDTAALAGLLVEAKCGAETPRDRFYELVAKAAFKASELTATMRVLTDEHIIPALINHFHAEIDTDRAAGSGDPGGDSRQRTEARGPSDDDEGRVRPLRVGAMVMITAMRYDSDDFLRSADISRLADGDWNVVLLGYASRTRRHEVVAVVASRLTEAQAIARAWVDRVRLP